jgi:membrane protease YdiL (CAAX protease family)
MINVLSILPTYVTPLFSKFLNNAGYDIAESLLSSAVYVISFIVPALLIRGILKKKDLLQPMRLTSGKFDAKALLLVPIAIAVIRAAATLNSKMLDIFGVSEVYSELVGLTTESYALYEIILLFISTAIVPGIVEEILFRGAVMSNLAPYGKTTALLGSALLFGLMHQNYYQLLYATVAGLVLGYAYMRTGNILCPILIHFSNNAFSVLQQVIYGNCPEVVANVLLIAMNLLITVLGIICAVIYIIGEVEKKKKKYKDGSFGRLLEPSPVYAEKAISESIAIKKFFTSGILTFTVVSLILATILLVNMMIMSFEM